MAEEQNNEPAPETNDTPEPAAPVTDSPAPIEPVKLETKAPSLTGDIDVKPPVEPDPISPDIDKRLFTEDGQFNKDGAKEFFAELKEKDDKVDKRLNDMRKMVSTKDDFVKDKSEYFQDFAPKEKYLKYFDKDTPEETKTEMNKIQDKLSETYHSLALNKSQSYGVSHAMLEIMESMGVLDTRSEEQVYMEKQKWIEGQKAKLGSNADNIIREAKEYIAGSSNFTAPVKVQMGELMETMGADFIDVIHQLKDSFGNKTGGVPASVANLQGLASDSELWQEYSNPKTTDFRRNEIIQQRALSGRTGRLADVLQQQ